MTESLIMEDIAVDTEKLKAARALGVKVAIDDFGTGYSSLAYLAKLPAEMLKIDRSFVHGMLTHHHNATLVHSIIGRAHSLQLTVVAEGVETEAQAAKLSELGCDQMQGYLISKPLPLDDLERLFASTLKTRKERYDLEQSQKR
jgi:EAL domain-containing protein (putative c-di-GMP-specific phosphodiesterase class I)